MKNTYPLLNSWFWLLNQYKNIVKLYTEQRPFRIVGREVVPETGEVKFIIKIERRMSPLLLTASELIDKPEFLEGFSRKDIQVITYQYFQDTSKPQYEFVGEKRTDSGLSVLLKDSQSPVTYVRNILDYNGIKKFISRLNPKSAFRIGYLVGTASKRNAHVHNAE